MPEQVLPSQAVRDWLDPNGREMANRNFDEVRREVARTLSTRIGVDCESDVLRWLSVWSNMHTTPSSGQRGAEIVALQLEAHDMFRCGTIEHLSVDAQRLDVKDIQRREGAFLRHLLWQMYQESQEQMRERGIESIILWRGESGLFSRDQIDPVDIGRLPLQPLNSFSHRLFQANRFTGRPTGSLIVVSAPASRILASPATGFGVLEQKEEVVFAIPSSVGLIDQGIIAQWKTKENYDFFSGLKERDWVELLGDFYERRSQSG